MDPVHGQSITLKVPENFVPIAEELNGKPLTSWASHIAEKEAEKEDNPILTTFLLVLQLAEQYEPYNRDIELLIKDSKKQLKKRVRDLTQITHLLSPKTIPHLREVTLQPGDRYIKKELTESPTLAKGEQEELIEWTKTQTCAPFELKKVLAQSGVQKRISRLTKLATTLQPKPRMANRIPLPINPNSAKGYLVSRAPQMLQEVPFFWENLIESGSKTIISLSKPGKKGKPKTYPYWDVKKIKTMTHTIERRSDDTTTLFEGEKGSRIVKRLFLVTENGSKKSHVVKQFHYVGQKDPKAQLLAELVFWVITNHQEEDTPLTVHCSTGKDHSFVFLMSHFLSNKIIEKQTRETEVRINVFEHMFQAMRQRRGFGPNKKQLTSIAQATQGVLERKAMWG